MQLGFGAPRASAAPRSPRPLPPCFLPPQYNFLHEELSRTYGPLCLQSLPGAATAAAGAAAAAAGAAGAAGAAAGAAGAAAAAARPANPTAEEKLALRELKEKKSAGTLTKEQGEQLNALIRAKNVRTLFKKRQHDETAGAVTASDSAAKQGRAILSRCCSTCGKTLPRASFSERQWENRAANNRDRPPSKRRVWRRCTRCVKRRRTVESARAKELNRAETERLRSKKPRRYFRKDDGGLVVRDKRADPARPAWRGLGGFQPKQFAYCSYHDELAGFRCGDRALW